MPGRIRDLVSSEMREKPQDDFKWGGKPVVQGTF